MILEIILLILGIALLVKGADYLVEGTSALAKKFGISALVIGLTIVALGTSLPELIVNVLAAIGGNSDIGLGNIIGSNLANTLLILGITALLSPIVVKHSTIWKEIPFNLLAVGVMLVAMNDIFLNNAVDAVVTRGEGIFLILFFLIFLYYVFEMSKNSRNTNEEKIQSLSNIKIATYITLGALGLFVGGKWVVDSAVFIATQLGLSEYLISATIVAIGTSLPELVTSVVAALKKNVDLAIGNAIGSNIFNVFFVLGTTAIIKPIPVGTFINFDLLFLLIGTLILFFSMFIGKKHSITQKEGIIFLLMYVGYISVISIRG